MCAISRNVSKRIFTRAPPDTNRVNTALFTIFKEALLHGRGGPACVIPVGENSPRREKIRTARSGHSRIDGIPYKNGDTSSRYASCPWTEQFA